MCYEINKYKYIYIYENNQNIKKKQCSGYRDTETKDSMRPKQYKGHMIKRRWRKSPERKD